MKVKAAKAPKEDPAIAAAREREEKRADAAFITNTQELLSDETQRRNRRFGRRVALTGAAPTPGTAQPIVSGGGGGLPLLGGLSGMPSVY